jgi:outer membrane protein assembly factor BamB
MTGNPWRTTLRLCLARIGWVALVFSAIVAVLLAADFARAGQERTVRRPELADMLEEVRQSRAGDPARAAFAAEMDRLARHAYFSSVQFRRHGIWMLAAGLLIGVGCLQGASRIGRRIEDPRCAAAADPARTDRRSRVAVAAAALTGAAALALWSAERGVRSAECGMRSAERGVRSAECGMRSAERGVRSAERGVRSAERGVRSAERGVRSAECGVRSAEGGSTDSAFRTPHSALVPASAGGDWPCFRGALAGIAAETNAPAAWDGASGAGVRWKAAVPPGVSSPVVGGGNVYVTAGDENERAVLAFDAATGAARWRQTVADGGAGEALPQPTPDTGFAASTPACDTAGVYAVFATGDLAAFDRAGKLRWQVYLKRPESVYGYASSLWAGGGLVVVQYDQKSGGRVVALRAATGETAWEQPRPDGASWSSPIVARAPDGRDVLILNGDGRVSGYDLARGAPLWEVEGVSGDVAPSPAAEGSRFFVAMAGAGALGFALAPAAAKQWENASVSPEVPSPVAAGGLLFVPADNGAIACLDAADGKPLWTHEFPAGFYASPIVCGDRLYALDREGVMHILSAGRTFRKIADCALGEAADATPAFAGGHVFIRTRTHLWCVGSR